MMETIREKTTHDMILSLIVEVVWKYAENNQPSPTIKDLSNHLGFSEELILESLEFGHMKPASLLQ